MLTDGDRALLAMERRHYRYDGAKATAVRAELGLTMTAYWQQLFALCERPEALAEEPVLVNRINRRRRAPNLRPQPGQTWQNLAEPGADVTQRP